MTTFEIEYHDDGPDALGRRHFTLHWTDPEFRLARHGDGLPSGYRRAQRFFCRPDAVMP